MNKLINLDFKIIDFTYILLFFHCTRRASKSQTCTPVQILQNFTDIRNTLILHSLQNKEL